MKHNKKCFAKKSAAVLTAAVFGLSATPTSVWAADDYQQNAIESLSKFAKDFSSQYETSLAAFDENKDFFGAKLNMSLSLDPSITTMLSGVAGMDMSWLSKISLVADESITKDKLGINYDIQLNDTEICPFNVYMDTASGNSYISAPTLFDGYLFMNTEDALENNGVTEELPAESLPALTEAFSMAQYKEKLPKPSDVEELLNRYGTILVNTPDHTETEAESLYTSDVEQNCTRYTGYYSPNTIYKISKELVTTVKEDEKLKEILDNYSNLFSSEENLYDNLVESLEEISEGEAPAEDEEGFLAISIWKDEDGNTTGTEFSLFTEEGADPISLVYQAPRQGEKQGLSISIYNETDSFLFAGSGSVTDGKLNGSYTISMNEIPMARIEVEGYDTAAAETGSIIGKYSVKLLDGAMTDESTAALLNNFTFVLDVNANKEKQDYSLSLVSEGVSLATLGINIVSSTDMEIPDLSNLENVYDVNDEVAMNGFEATLNLETLFNNLLSAGMPEELLTALLMGDAAADPSAVAPEGEQATADAA